jgi:hypothetical protein
MSLSNEAIKELKEIYRKKFNEDLSDIDAHEMGESLILLFRVIYRPLPERNQNDNHENSKSS